MRSADGFLKRLAEHISGQTDPVAAVVERVAFAAETLAGDRQIQHLLTKRQQGGTIVSLTSDVALAFGRSMLHRLDIDWERHGFDDAALDELAGLSLRTLHSILIDPGRPLRDAITLCRFVARWLGRRSFTLGWLRRWMLCNQPRSRPFADDPAFQLRRRYPGDWTKGAVTLGTSPPADIQLSHTGPSYPLLTHLMMRTSTERVSRSSPAVGPQIVASCMRWLSASHTQHRALGAWRQSKLHDSMFSGGAAVRLTQ